MYQRTYRTQTSRCLAFEYLEERRLLTASVTYHGSLIPGIIPHVQVSTVYWGSAWQTNAALRANSQTLDNFYGMIVNSGYMDMLSEYPGPYHDRSGNHVLNLGRGSLVATDRVTANLTATPVTEPQIQSMLDAEINAGRVGGANQNSLYVIYLPPGTPSLSAINLQAGGYHYNYGHPIGGGVFQSVSYAVIPFPTYAPNSPNAIQLQTIIGSHELAEAVTNVRFVTGVYLTAGLGWWDPVSGREIGDLAEGVNQKIGLYNGYWVQAEWSNVSSPDHRILPPGTTNMFAKGNGQGIYPAGQNGISEVDPLAENLPVASAAATYSALLDQTLSVSPSDGLLRNYQDPNGLPLQIQIETTPAHGQLTANPDGSFLYLPELGYVGNDDFSFSVSDGVFQSEPTTASITIAPLPGDYNLDHSVNAADYAAWRMMDGTQAGYDLWRAHFGEATQVAAGSAAAQLFVEPAKSTYSTSAAVPVEVHADPRRQTAPNALRFSSHDNNVELVPRAGRVRNQENLAPVLSVVDDKPNQLLPVPQQTEHRRFDCASHSPPDDSFFDSDLTLESTDEVFARLDRAV